MIELAKLKEADVDLQVTGFGDDELRMLLNEDGVAPTGDDVEEEEIPEVPVEPVTRPGDPWLIGGHRLTTSCRRSRDPVHARCEADSVPLCS